ncbi:hypothetical protein [Bradyrhizobium sp. Ash2021]|uniref:hypothetical protein n=1 Tax=Bradyrhizobium sp. Ash2021 TaxID=2954771 RepID=UPI00281504B5|nr:hypothetical protein [Bradyrhizobium sp. Ash2021]WMT79375.1 hypothetical protein NL528_06215 [Bradyrhizobium sp. Ash2021]
MVKDEDALTKVIHPSCLKRQRMSRLRELRSRSKQELSERDICWWLEAACAPTVPDDIACLALVAALSKSREWWSFRERVRKAEIVLADAGKLVSAQDAVVDGATTNIDSIYQVEPKLLADAASRKVLVDLLSIKSLDNEEWERRMRRVVGTALGEQGVRETLAWKSAWRLLSVAPPTVLEKISNLFDQIKIRCLDNGWRYRHQVLLLGRIVSEDELDVGASLLVDLEVHKPNASIPSSLDSQCLSRSGDVHLLAGSASNLCSDAKPPRSACVKTAIPCSPPVPPAKQRWLRQANTR